MSRRRVRALLGLFALVLFLPSWAQGITIQDVSPSTASFRDVYDRGGTGGRVNGIAIDPVNTQIMYAASEWGGIYKSIDGGKEWNRLQGHRPMVTWDVEVNPANHNRVYATSLYDGRTFSLSGINVSTDGGATWTKPLSSIPPAGLCNRSADQTELSAFGIAIDRADPSRIYIGTSCGLAISTDAGDSWTFTAPGGASFTGKRIWDVVSAVPGIVDTCGDSGHWWNVSGNDWYQGSGLLSGICSIASSPYYPAFPNLFAVVGTTIYETTNGVTWTQTRTNLQAQGRVPFVETNKRSAAPGAFDLWFGDVLLWRVRCDANAIGPRCGTGNVPPWSATLVDWGNGFGDQGAIAFMPGVAVDACPVLNSADAGVVYNARRENNANEALGCQTPKWTIPDKTPHGLWPFGLAGIDPPGDNNDHVYLGTQDNGILGTFDGAGAWGFDECCDVFDVLTWPATSTDPARLLYSIYSGYDLRRLNLDFSGRWSLPRPSGPTGPLPALGTFPDSFAYFGENSVVEVEQNAVRLTQNIHVASPTWTSLGPVGAGGCAVYSARNAPVFYVQNALGPWTSPRRECNGELSNDTMWRYVGVTPGQPWTRLSLPGEAGFGVFAVDPNNPNRLLASGNTGEDAHMYLSTNAGVSWTGLPGLDALMRGGGDFKILNQRGPTNFTKMDGYYQPSLVAFDPFDPSNMIAGGRDSGIFYSKDGGVSWTLVTDPRNSHISGIPHIPRPKHAYFSEADHNKSIYVSSQGGGVFKLGICSADVYEPDDDSVTPASIASGAIQSRSLCATGDQDEASFTLAAPSAVTVGTGGGYAGNIDLELTYANGPTIAHDTGSVAGFSQVSRTCAANSFLPAGTYRIFTSEVGFDDTIASYNLGLSVTPCCGNGTVDAQEICDDGNTNNNDGCLATCVPATCGDGVARQGVEQCDDGNGNNNDGCLDTCIVATCGDGFVQTGVEACDDGNHVDNDACTNACISATCGDGVTEAGTEQCDDGNGFDDDACLSNCIAATCGDGFVHAGVELCDDGNLYDGDDCPSSCLPATCGDGFLRDGVEACDDGNLVTEDDCLASCVPASCGDGYVRAGVEPCDDGNLSDEDACLTTCLPASCGDGILWAGVEQCDDGNAVNEDYCLSTCVVATCGDGFLWAGVEWCDDGNLVNEDDCLTYCYPAFCGDGFLHEGVESCDDGNSFDFDDCLSSCVPASCGDGWLHFGVELCDDGNLEDGDCCSGGCAFEPQGFACDDGSPCTATSACNGIGTCEGQPAAPAPVGLAPMSKTLLQWVPDPLAEYYDVVYGSLNTLRVAGDYTAATTDCLGDRLTTPQVDISTITPPPGSAIFFLIRAVGCVPPSTFNEPPGSHQVGDRDPEIQASGVPCMP